MPSIKFYYFGVRGRGELSRIIMAYGGLEHEEVTINRDQWMELKPKVPFGQVPALEVDGKFLTESNAINRYLAKLTGIAGEDEFEAAQMDMIVDQCLEITRHLVTFFFEKDEQKKAEAKKKLEEEQLPKSFENLDKYLEKGSGYFVGDKISWADLSMFRLLEALSLGGFSPDPAKYPKIVALEEKVKSHPKIADYLARRPPSEH